MPDLEDPSWEVYPFKPVAQASWESEVKSACVAAAQVECPDPSLTPDLRPRIYDYNAKLWFLVDSGAACSCFPKSYFPDAQPDPTKILQAVNGAKIATYGQRQIKVDLGGRTYTHTFILSDIQEPICGWDMILAFRLDLVWSQEKGKPKCHLEDRAARRVYPVHLKRAKQNNVILALVTYKQYSEKQKAAQTKEKVPIPPAYQQLIDKYKGILTVNFTKVPKHNVIHTIDTGTNKPCRAKLRPLLKGSPKEVDGYKAWKELEDLGIVEKVGPDTPTYWSSALHLVTKAL